MKGVIQCELFSAWFLPLNKGWESRPHRSRLRGAVRLGPRGLTLSSPDGRGAVSALAAPDSVAGVATSILVHVFR